MDIHKDMAVNQGYVPETCTLDGQLVMALMNDNGNPCNGCNEDRTICKGRKSETD